MSKVVQAVNAMISNPGWITNIARNDTELFFLYKGKYKWSINRNDDGDYNLFYYPGDQTIDSLAHYPQGAVAWERVPMVRYSTDELGTKEALASFSELFRVVNERAYGINEVLNDIISDMDI